MRGKTVFSMCLVLGLTALGFGQTSSTIDASTVGSAIYKIIDFVLKYVVPGICGLIFIKGAVDMASGRPDAAKTMILAIVGLILALGAKAIIKLVTGVTIPT
jgi:hypothetical protein